MPSDQERRQGVMDSVNQKYGVEAKLGGPMPSDARTAGFYGNKSTVADKVSTPVTKDDGFAKQITPTESGPKFSNPNDQLAADLTGVAPKATDGSSKSRPQYATANDAILAGFKEGSDKPAGTPDAPIVKDDELESQLQASVNDAQLDNQLQDAIKEGSPQTGTGVVKEGSPQTETGITRPTNVSSNTMPSPQVSQQQPSSEFSGLMNSLQGLAQQGPQTQGIFGGIANKFNVGYPAQGMLGGIANKFNVGPQVLGGMNLLNGVANGMSNLMPTTTDHEITLRPPQSQFDVQNATTSAIQNTAENEAMKMGNVVSGSIASQSSGMVDPGSLSSQTNIGPSSNPIHSTVAGSSFAREDMNTTPVDPLGDDIAMKLFNLLSPSLFYSAKNQAMETKSNNYIENIFV
jgi:phage shock protein PspC (stress-responsive transcriptional regulator)